MKSTISSLVRYSVAGAVVILLTATAPAQTNTAFVVYPEFQNVLTNSQDNPSNQNSFAIFSGSEGAYSPPGSGLPPVLPVSVDGIQLANSGFGQMLGRTVPYADFELQTILNAQAILYPPASANTRALIAATTNAFRYKQLLYTENPTNNSLVRAEFEGIATYFGNSERQQARDGIEILRTGLKYSPLNRDLRYALLDAYYDYIVAEAQHVKNDLSTVAKYRLGLVAIPPGQFIIDQEIAGYTNIVQKYGNILDEYAKLFVDRGGIDVSQFDSNASSGLPLGQWIFQQEQPQRNQMAAQFRNTNGVLTSVPAMGTTNSLLFAGYKDYVALLAVMRDYAQSAAELAKLYGMRSRASVLPGQKDDKTLGFELIEGINREILLNNSLLNALLPNALPPESQLDASGVRAAYAGVLTSTAELTKVGSFLNSQVNFLGFDPDFLVLISTFVDSNQQHLWDSYDALNGWLESPNTTSSILGRARNAFTAAHDSYDTYRGHADQVFNEMSANESSFAQRYREICGYNPDETADPYPTNPAILASRFPPVDTNAPPTHANNPRAGSELRLVHQSFEQSNVKSASLASSAVLVDAQLVLAHDRLASSSNRTDAINEATKTYKDVIGTERDTITSWSAKQAASQAAYETVSDTAAVSASIAGGNPIGAWGAGFAIGATVVAGAVNTGIQYKGELKKGDAEKNLDLAAADFDKDLALADTDQNIFQAGEEQRNLERERQSQVLTMQDNGFVRDQEMERRDGLLREMQQALVVRNQNDSDLAGRYYADPIHYLRAQNNMIRADLAFRSAQRWVFFLLRALEYKYNRSFIHVNGSTTWELSSVFRVRNAEELDDLVAEIRAFNQDNLTVFNGNTISTDRISLKDHVWGRTITNQTARAAEFQRQLAQSYDSQRGEYRIKLNTLRLSTELANGGLFRGAVYDLLGDLSNPGFYLDKIEWVKIKFVDSAWASPELKVGNLSYGGTSFDRPRFASAVEPSGLENPSELRSFPFRFFDMGTGTNGVLTATSSAEQRASFNFAFWNQASLATEPDPDYEQTFWRERSVAISEFSMSLLANQVNTNTLQDIQIYIRHRRAVRQ
jgi:hypothetical protein